MGRPTLYRPEYCDQVVAWGRKGKSRTWITATLDIAPSTLRAWEEAQPDFAAAMSRAMTHAQAFWEDVGQDNLSNPQFNGAVWGKIMAARFRADWGDRRQVEVEDKRKPDEKPAQSTAAWVADIVATMAAEEAAKAAAKAAAETKPSSADRQAQTIRSIPRPTHEAVTV